MKILIWLLPVWLFTLAAPAMAIAENSKSATLQAPAAQAKKVAEKAKTSAKKPSARAASNKKKAKNKAVALPPLENSPKYAALVIEAQTGRILRASNIDSLRHPASLTKMMTLYMTFQALEAGRLQINQRLPVSSNAAAQSPSKLGLRTGQSVSVEDAILGLITESANDAAVVLAEAMAGSESEFGRLMTRQARALGMSKTVFRNPSGLPDPEQVTTARDMGILGYALMAHYPRFYPLFSRERFAYNGITHDNHNRLMRRYAGMDGIKTGYIRASGFNLVSSAVQNNVRLIGVVFGGYSAVSRDNHMAQLLDQAFASLPQDGGARYAQIQSATEAAALKTAGEAQGDTNLTYDPNYIPLPAKVAAVFPPPGVRMAMDLPRNEGAIQREARLGQMPAPAPVSPPAPNQPVMATNWGVQIGAFSDPAIGKQALAALVQGNARLLQGADQILQKIAANDGSAIYRARFMGLSENNARQLCAGIMQQGQSCLVVAPVTAARL